MAEAEAEQADLARMPGGLLVNFGTVESLDGMLAAGRYANQIGKPVVFDPVGIGATAFRQATAASEHLCTLLCRYPHGDHNVGRRTIGRMATDGDQGQCSGDWRPRQHE